MKMLFSLSCPNDLLSGYVFDILFYSCYIYFIMCPKMTESVHLLTKPRVKDNDMLLFY